MSFELDHSFGFSMRDDLTTHSRAESVWRELSEAAGYSKAEPASGSALARLISERGDAGIAAQMLFRRLTDVAEAVRGSDAQETAARFSELIGELHPEILGAAIATETNLMERKPTLRKIAAALGPSSVLVLIEAAAHAYARPLSHVLSALLSKLAREAEVPGEARAPADRAYRELINDIIDFWSTRSVDVVSAGYDSIFGDQNEPERVAQHAGSVAPDAERVLALAFESGASGSVVWSVLAELGEKEHGVRQILDMIKRAPRGSRAAATVAQQFANPARLTALLREEPIDFLAVDALLAHMGKVAAPALLDALAEAKVRTVRRGLLDRLAAIGPEVGSLAADRLKKDERWYVKRNMLTLLREAKCQLNEVPLDAYTAHADARVRREVTQLLLLKPAERDRALAAALRDADVHMLKIGLKAARANLPESVVPILARRVVEPQFPPEFRTSALHLLARSNSVMALEPLLRYVSGGTTILGRQKLAPKSPEMLIALGGLARAWPNERRASVLLALARDSKDADIAKAAAAGARGVVAEDKDVPDDE